MNDGMLLPVSNLPDDVWVCEEHPDLPMGHDGCDGAGMLAPGVDEAFNACAYGASREDVERLSTAIREWRICRTAS